MYEQHFTCYYMNYEGSTLNSNSYPISNTNSLKKKTTRRSKHIPHHLRPQHIVEIRNTRERKRVHDVNQAFLLLKAVLPFDNDSNNKDSTHISKLRTLRKAIDYIKALEILLNKT